VIDRFLTGRRWRWGRMVAAWGLMFTGCVLVGSMTGFVVTLFGFVPFVESLYDVNLVAPLLRRPLSAAKLHDNAAV
jgi:hypothetical protein